MCVIIFILLTAVPVFAGNEPDSDNDSLSDQKEILFQTDPASPDTDGDGYLDGIEIKNGYDPLTKDKKLPKKIEIDTRKQELSYFLGNVKLDSFPVSTGKPSMPTPKGAFKISSKYPKAWSKTYGLWMPYWMSFKRGYGIHELPYWPGGYREGADHLGKPVSHGCIRLGVGPAKILYEWAEIGTAVKIF